MRDVWLIDNDHKEDEEEGASETGPDEGAPDAASTAEQNSRPHKPSNHGCGDNGGSGATAKGGTQGSMAEADDIGQHRATTCKKGEAVDVEGEFPSVGETAVEMMGTMNMALRNLRDQG